MSKPSAVAMAAARALFEAGHLKSGRVTRAARLIDDATVVLCDKCGNACCGACSWNPAKKRHECSFCDGSWDEERDSHRVMDRLEAAGDKGWMVMVGRHPDALFDPESKTGPDMAAFNRQFWATVNDEWDLRTGGATGETLAAAIHAALDQAEQEEEHRQAVEQAAASGGGGGA